MDLKKELEQKKKEIPGFNKRDENGPDSSSSFNSDDPDKEAEWTIPKYYNKYAVARISLELMDQ